MGFFRTALAIAVGSSSLFTLTNAAQASEFYVGEAVRKNGLEVGAVYLDAIEMEPEPPMRPGKIPSISSAIFLLGRTTSKDFQQGLGFPISLAVIILKR